MNNTNIIEDLISILSTKIKKFEKDLRKKMTADPSKETIKQIIERIKSDKYAIASLSKKSLLDYLSKYLVSKHEVDVEEISSFFEERYSVTEAVARGYTQGIMIKFDKDDEKTINKLINYLERCLVVIESQMNSDVDAEVDKSSFAIYYELYDKLRSESKDDFISEDEINLIEELISDKEIDYYKKVMSIIYKYNRGAYKNKEINAENLLDELGAEALEKRKYSIDEEMLKRIFDEYGFTLAGMPDDIYQALLSTCDAGKIIDIFEFINANPRYSFIKDFGKSSYITENEHGKKVEIPKNKTLLRREANSN